MIWVIDTSAVIRLFVPDGPIHAEAESAFNRAATGAELILAPHLLLVEAANVLLRKQRRGELAPAELRELLLAINALPIRYCDHGALLVTACDLAQAHGLSAYGALYLALAEQHGARLMTCDEALDKVAQKIGLA